MASVAVASDTATIPACSMPVARWQPRPWHRWHTRTSPRASLRSLGTPRLAVCSPTPKARAWLTSVALRSRRHTYCIACPMPWMPYLEVWHQWHYPAILSYVAIPSIPPHLGIVCPMPWMPYLEVWHQWHYPAILPLPGQTLGCSA